MENTNRRRFLKVAGLGGLATGVGAVLKTASAESHDHSLISGPLAQATVAFGVWQGEQGLDRMDPEFNPRTTNQHVLAPGVVKIRAGGAVNFVVAGFHQIAIYDDGIQPGNIDINNLVAPQGSPPGFPSPLPPILIDDPVGRTFRGLDPGLQPLDRVESVFFASPGLYLVICTVLPHFLNDAMFGYVKVLP